jgi:hypothetical protein
MFSRSEQSLNEEKSCLGPGFPLDAGSIEVRIRHDEEEGAAEEHFSFVEEGSAFSLVEAKQLRTSDQAA